MDFGAISNALSGGTTVSQRTVAYYYDDDIGTYMLAETNPMRPHRTKITHDLVRAYGLDEKMDVLKPRRSTAQDMTAFHTDEYVDVLHTLNLASKDWKKLTGNGSRFVCVVEQDCPAFDGVFEFVSISAGGSVEAAKRLNSGKADIGINWAGGLHHAKKVESSGFCYVNDIVLGILELLKHHQRVLYIDIDVHHGDGVEEAFYTTDRVMTCSFHRYGGFFPWTGALDDVGISRGKNYSINVPLKEGIDDTQFHQLFQPVIRGIMEHFQPGAVVLQCGADSLAGDKLGPFNLSMEGHAACVSFVRSFNVPMMVLGGGGYTLKNVARTWAYETATAIGCQNELDRELPWNDYFDWFGPDYKLQVLPTNAANMNSQKDVDLILETITERLRSLSHAPSVGMKRLGDFESEEEESDDEDAQNMRLEPALPEIHVNGNGRPRPRYREATTSENESAEDETRTRHGLNTRNRSRSGGTPVAEDPNDAIPSRKRRRKNVSLLDIPDMDGQDEEQPPQSLSRASGRQIATLYDDEMTLYSASEDLAANKREKRPVRYFFTNRAKSAAGSAGVTPVVTNEANGHLHVSDDELDIEALQEEEGDDDGDDGHLVEPKGLMKARLRFLPDIRSLPGFEDF
ncbi:hypothetical protein BT69DRAFT_1313145 [Atractiella rhizophila]|nr:hypothetical protein BT69DRAFT_1313145 [Atractiella rhizophila]